MATPAPAAASRTATERPRILVVDDESSIRDLLAKTLSLSEYDVDTAADGRAALERLRLFPYDLLIVDLNMPGIDGLTVIREAKRLKADIPVIVITGFSTESDAIEALNLGVTGYLTKPFRIPQVLAAASKAIGESTLNSECYSSPPSPSPSANVSCSKTSPGRFRQANALVSAAPTAPARPRC